VVRVFPHEQSCLRLVTALLMETNQEWMEQPYLNMQDSTLTVRQEALAPAAA
jgi:transposase-like protein